nr:hypothetical protein [Tanacetum cinerariifolium]
MALDTKCRILNSVYSYSDEDIALVSTHDDVSIQDNIVQDEGIKDVGEEVVEGVTTAKIIIDAVVDDVQVTTAIANIAVSAAKTIITTAPTINTESTKINVEVTQAPKRKGVMIQELEETTTTKTSSSQKPQVQDKGKGKAKMIEELVKLKKKDQILFDEEAKEQQELNEEEKAKLFMELLEKRRKFFAAKRTEEKRNRPSTKAQQRIHMINTFVNFKTELVKESSKKAEAKITQEKSSKRAGDELEQETAKKEKIVDNKETINQKQPVKIIPEEDIAIDDFDRESVETLCKLVKAKYGLTRPEEDYDRVLREEFTSEPAVETLNAKTSEEVPKVVKKDNGAPIIEDWNSDDEDESVPRPKIEKKKSNLVLLR